MHLFVKFEPNFCKKVNPFSIKSEPILQNEPIRILYPFRSPFPRSQSKPLRFGLGSFLLWFEIFFAI